MLGKFSVKKPYTVLVAVVLVIVLGVVSFMKMTTDLLPNISLPYVIVMTTYPGASPETVEMVVTKPVESSMATVSNIEGISSVSSENYSMVILEFAQSADMNAVSLEIRESLDQIKSYWSEDIGSPIIMKLNPDMLPVMIAAVGGTDMSASEVSDMTQNTIIPELESIEGVASANATGLFEESVNVIIRQEKIDAINEQVFGYIDGEMEEAKQDLVEGKQEIYDGQKELEDARSEMEDSRQEIADGWQELEDSKKEIEDSKKEIEDGKQEIAENKSKLEEGKNELAQKKSETTKKLAEAEKEILTAKADLEATKMHITSDLKMVEKAAEGLKEAEEGLVKIINAASAQGFSEISDVEDAIIDLDSLKSRIESTKEELEGHLNGGNNNLQDITDSSSYISAINGYLSSLNISGSVDESTGISEAIGALEAAGTAADTAISGLTSLKDGWEKAEEMIPNLKDSINANTMGLGVDAYTQMMQDSLKEIDSNSAKLDSALTEIYEGNLKAAIEFANAQTTISLGELQLTTAESQLKAGEKQIEVGEEQLEAGKEQLEKGQEQLADGEEQLKSTAEQLSDALQQILDGEEDLAQAWEDAYAQADMHEVLTVDTVKSLLTAQNFSMPGGYVTEDGIDYLVRVGDKPDDVEELKKMPIMNPEMDGVSIVTLGDVADVFMTDNSGEIYANVNGETGIMITLQKQTGYSTGDVSDKILAKFDELRSENPDLILITLMDQGIYIDLVMDSIINNVLFGAILAVFILILFLKDLRPTAVIACSIPISLVTAIVCMYFSGITLNVISLSGLALGIGMLVDNSIVVIENIYRMRNEGYSAKEAAIKGAGEVAGAIMASTLTTVCVFAPIVFTEGITRQLFVDMGLTIAYSLLASLLIALTVVPAMASKVLVSSKPKKEGRFFAGLMNAYEKLLAASLKVKPAVLVLVLVLLIVSALASFAKGTAFMPEMESPQMNITLTMPKDTPLSDTAEVSDEVVTRIMSIEEVEDVGAMSSSSSMTMLTGGGNTPTNSVDIYVSLSEEKERSNEEIAGQIDEMLTDIMADQNAEIVIETSSMDMSALGGSGISIQVRGRELDTLQKLAKDIAGIVEGVEGTAEVSDGLEEVSGELRIIVDRDKAIEHGLTVAQIYQQISAKLSAAVSATTLSTEIRDYDVYVKNEGDMKLTRELVKGLEITRTKQDGTREKVLLSDIADFENTESPKSVNRSDQSRYIAVSAGIADGYNVGLVSAEVESAIAEYEMPNGYTLVMSGENETINDAMEQVFLMLLLAVIFMYLIMVAQFQSLLSPFIIMFTIPLAFTGGFFGLLISGSEVSVIALIGFVMLSGIIVNNGIVLVDYINQLRSEGMEKKEAILTAGKTRIRPVLMTALTTILALCTMAFSNDMGADMAKPMAIVTIGGLIYGTLLTLIVIPCIYDIFMREKKGEIYESQE